MILEKKFEEYSNIWTIWTKSIAKLNFANLHHFGGISNFPNFATLQKTFSFRTNCKHSNNWYFYVLI
jgi:hypothetical protein